MADEPVAHLAGRVVEGATVHYNSQGQPAVIYVPEESQCAALTAENTRLRDGIEALRTEAADSFDPVSAVWLERRLHALLASTSEEGDRG